MALARCGRTNAIRATVRHEREPSVARKRRTAFAGVVVEDLADHGPPHPARISSTH